MENKYYTPTIEEFHIGFEYEWLDEEGNWNKENTPTEITPDGYDEQEYGLRVKYLNKEDIESLGFKKSLKSQWAGWDDYYTENLNAGRDYYLYATLHFPRGVTDLTRIEDNLFEIILHRFYKSDEHGTTEIEDCIEQRESEVVFKGIIKNKSKLKEILELVGIETKSI